MARPIAPPAKFKTPTPVTVSEPAPPPPISAPAESPPKPAAPATAARTTPAAPSVPEPAAPKVDRGGTAETAQAIYRAAKARGSDRYTGPRTPDEVIEERAVFYGEAPDTLRSRLEAAGFFPAEIDNIATAGGAFDDILARAQATRQAAAPAPAAPPATEPRPFKARKLEGAAPFLGIDPETDPEIAKEGDPAWAEAAEIIAEGNARGIAPATLTPLYQEMNAPELVIKMRRKALTDMGTTENDATPEQFDEATKYALKQVAARKTQGQWTGAAALPTFFLTGETPRWYHNFMPLVEIGGFDPQGDVVYRQQGQTSFWLDMDGIPSAVLIGAVEAMSKGRGPAGRIAKLVTGAATDEDMTLDSWWDSLDELGSDMATAVGERRNLVEEGSKQGRRLFGSPGVYAGAALGLAGEFLMPGLIPTSVTAVRKGARAALDAKSMRSAKQVAADLDDLAGLIEEGVAARKAGDTTKSNAAFAEAAKRESALREQNPEIASALDRVIGTEAVDPGVNPDIRDARLAENVLGARPPGYRSHLVSSVRKTTGMLEGSSRSPQAVGKAVARDYATNYDDVERIVRTLRDPAMARTKATAKLDSTIKGVAAIIGAGTADQDAAYRALKYALDSGAGLNQAVASIVARNPRITAAARPAVRRGLDILSNMHKGATAAEAKPLKDAADRLSQAVEDSTNLHASATRKLADHFRTKGLTDPTASAKSFKVADSAAEAFHASEGGDIAEWKRLDAGEIPDYMGKTQADMAQMNRRLDELRIKAATLRDAPLRLGTQIADSRGGVQEVLPAESLRAFAQQVGTVESAPGQAPTRLRRAVATLVRGAAAIVLGSDVDRVLRTLPAATRNIVVSSLRELGMVNADIILLARNADTNDDLIKYIKGEVVRHYSGRIVATSGWDASDAARKVLYDIFADLKPDVQIMLEMLATEAAKGEAALARLYESLPDGQQNANLKAARDFLSRNNRGNDFISQFVEMVGVAETPTPQDWVLVGGMLKYASGGDVEDLLKLVDSQYGAPNMTRAAVWIGAYGHRQRVVSEWVRHDNIIVSKGKYEAFLRMLQGNPMTTADVTMGRQVLEAWGLHTHAVSLLGDAIDVTNKSPYIPQAAREAMNQQVDALMGAARRVTGETDPKMVHGGVAVSVMKAMMTRGLMFANASYYLMNLTDSLALAYQAGGVKMGLAHAIQLAPQNLMAIPGLANVLAYKSGRVEAFRRWLGNVGDAGGRLFSDTVEAAAMDVSVNKVYEGSGIIVLNNRSYNVADLRRVFVREGVMTGFEVEGIGRKVIQESEGAPGSITGKMGAAPRKFFRKASDMTVDAAADLSEGWAERERMGLAILLIRSGVDPFEAARMSNRGLLQFRRGDSTIERSLFFSMIQPFWTYTRAANEMMINLLADPQAMVRAGRAARLFHRGPDALQDIQDEMVARDPYGMDLDKLPPELRKTYDSLLALKYSTRMSREEEKQFDAALMALARGMSEVYLDGRRYELRDDLQNASTPTNIAPYMLQEQLLAALPSYVDGGAVQIQWPRTEQVRRVSSAMADQRSAKGYLTGNGMARTYVYMTEPSVVGQLGFIATLIAAPIVMGSALISNDRAAASAVGNMLADLSSPQRNPVGRNVLAATDPQSAAPYNLHPTMAKILTNFGWGSMIEYRAGELTEETGEVLQNPAPYIVGTPAIAFRTTPGLDQINRLFYAVEDPDLAITETAYADALQAMKFFLGVRTMSR